MITRDSFIRHLSYMVEEFSKRDDDKTLSVRDKYIEKRDEVSKMSDEEFGEYLKNSRYFFLNKNNKGGSNYGE